MMIEEIRAGIKKEQKQNWKDFEMWAKKKYPFMTDMIKKYKNKSIIPDIITFLMDEYRLDDFNKKKL